MNFTCDRILLSPPRNCISRWLLLSSWLLSTYSASRSQLISLDGRLQEGEYQLITNIFKAKKIVSNFLKEVKPQQRNSLKQLSPVFLKWSRRSSVRNIVQNQRNVNLADTGPYRILIIICDLFSYASPGCVNDTIGPCSPLVPPARSKPSRVEQPAPRSPPPAAPAGMCCVLLPAVRL